MDLYLKLDDNNWYYFGYTRELMQVISSDRTFNDRLSKLPEKQRKTNERPGFTYMIASTDKLNQFMRQYQQREAQGAQPQLTPIPSPAPSVQDAGRQTPTPPPVAQPEKKEEEESPIIEIE